MLLARIDPLDEGGDVDLHLTVRERGEAVLGDPRSGGAAVRLRLLPGPLA
jgi:hypothetical protein